MKVNLVQVDQVAVLLVSGVLRAGVLSVGQLDKVLHLPVASEVRIVLYAVFRRASHAVFSLWSLLFAKIVFESSYLRVSG